MITDIKKGLTLGDYLLLPDELRFTASRMSLLLFPHGQMRPLQHIRLVCLHELYFLWYPSYLGEGGQVEHCVTDTMATGLEAATDY